MKDDTRLLEDDKKFKYHITKATVIIKFIDYYANNIDVLSYGNFCDDLRKLIMDEFPNDNIVWEVSPIVAVRMKTYALNGNERGFVLSSSYIRLYNDGINIYEWKNRVIRQAEALKKLYDETSVRVEFTKAEVVVIK